MSDRDTKALRDAAQALIDKLALVHDDPRYMTVWQCAQAHIGPYEGPKYEREMNELRAVLLSVGHGS